ncbi:hypothetical protein ES703_124737 [subsurface metagenome]
MLVGPGTLLIVGLIGGAGAAATFASYAYAQQKGPELTKSLSSNLSSMAPMAPKDGPPLPQGLGIRWPWRK